MAFPDLSNMPYNKLYIKNGQVGFMKNSRNLINISIINDRGGKKRYHTWETFPLSKGSELTISTGGVLFIGTHCIGIYSSSGNVIKILYEPNEPQTIQLTQSMSKTLDNIRNRRMNGKYDKDRLNEIHRFLIGACGMRGIQLPK